MNPEPIIETLAKLPSEVWHTATEIGTDKEVPWLTLLIPGEEHSPKIGMSIDASWVVVSDKGLSRIDSSAPSPAWLLIIDCPLQEIRDRLDIQTQKLNMQTNLSSLLPFESILMTGLTYGSDRGLAPVVSWLEAERSLMSPKVRDYLEKMSTDRVYSQSLRHRAAKLAAPLRGKYVH